MKKILLFLFCSTVTLFSQDSIICEYDVMIPARDGTQSNASSKAQSKSSCMLRQLHPILTLWLHFWRFYRMERRLG